MGRKNGELFLREADGNHDRPKTWIVEKNEKQGTFSFKSEKHGTYLCAEKKRVVANRRKKKQWERWRVIVIRDAKHSDIDEQPGSAKGTKVYHDALMTQGGPSQDQPDDVTEPMVQNDG